MFARENETQEEHWQTVSDLNSAHMLTHLSRFSQNSKKLS